MTRGEKFIFLFLVFSGVLAVFLQSIFFSGGSDMQAVIEVNGEEYGRYFIQEKNGKTLAISTEFGYNKIVIENGTVSVIESSCPDQLEMKAGPIQNRGETLICLPNRLVIRIDGGGGVDGVSY